MLVNKSIPGFYNGVSQQPPTIRLDTQGEEVINGLPSLVSGLTKRPPTEHKKTLDQGNSVCVKAEGIYVTVKVTHVIPGATYAIYLGGVQTVIGSFTVPSSGATIDAAGIAGELMSSILSSSLNTITATMYRAGELVLIHGLSSELGWTTATDPMTIGVTCSVPGVIHISQADIPLEFITVPLVAPDDWFHWFSHGDDKYVAVIHQWTGPTGLPIDIFNITLGSWCSLQFAPYDDKLGDIGTYAGAYPSPEYLKTPLSPCDSFVATTVQGQTIIVNKTRKCQTLGVQKPADSSGRALVSVLKGVTSYDTQSSLYEIFITDGDNPEEQAALIWVFGVSVTISNITALLVAGDMSQFGLFGVNVGRSKDRFMATVVSDSVLSISRVDANDTTPFKVRVKHSFDTRAISVANPSSGGYSVVQSVTKLPTLDANVPPNLNQIMMVAGDPASAFDDYWVQFSNSDGLFAEGVWLEVPDPMSPSKFDPTTMPHRLVQLGRLSFVFSQGPWADRCAGSEKSMPPPSFINQNISGIFLFRERLGFLSYDSICMSRSGDYFNFWRATASALLDNDPLDLTIPTNEGNDLMFTAAYEKSLILFDSGQLQYNLGSGDAPLTPKTAVAAITTRFAASRVCPPITVGSNIYFACDRENHAAVREYYVQSATLTHDAADISAHVSEYLPPTLNRLVGSSAYDILLGFSKTDPQTLYVYKYLWSGDQKAQSAWVKWTFGADILSYELMGSLLYILFDRDGLATLETININNIR